jgi:imidazolonepropionase-like amidohydrolase
MPKNRSQAEATLMRGFTTVRDLGGPVFGLKRAIDEGVTIGPRIYPSGAFISQTSGHGDFRFSFEVPRVFGGPLSRSEIEGIAAIADSPDDVRCERESS